jgi:triphosphoribosyl-dephospho-CoA synthase
MTSAERARASFLRACALDVLVRKPGNVSVVSPGHGMDGALFIASAQAAAGPLFAPGARVGERIDNAVADTWAVAGCNTNLGILLLCAPIAAAAERLRESGSSIAWRAAIEQVLSELNLQDSRAAYHAIARARPGGLGHAPAEDVNAPPTIGLRDAMALAATRDRIARQYRDGFAELFEIGLAATGPGFSIMAPAWDADPNAPTIAAVQRIYLAWLGTQPDSHIVRKRGEALAHTVMAAAQAWRGHAEGGAELNRDPAFAAWDAALKAEGINPGTSADLTVATLMLAALCDSGERVF